MKIIFIFLFTIPLFAAQITSVNFVQQGEVSQLVITHSGEVTYEKNQLAQQKQVILDVKNVSASPRVLRAINTSEFSGSMTYISAFPNKANPNDIRFVVQLRDNARSRVKASFNKLVLEVENRFGAFAQAGETKIPQAVGSQKTNVTYISESENSANNAEISDILNNLVLSGNKKYYGKKISINVKKLAISDLLKMIAQVSGFNILISRDAEQKPPVTLNLRNIPWDEALDTILELNGLVATKHLNILHIITKDKFVADEQAKIDAEKANKVLEPLETRIFSINFSELTEIEGAIRSHLTTGRGSTTASKRTSKLIVKDTEKQLAKIGKIISEIDVETPQVLIEARIVEISDGYSKELGLVNGLSGDLNLLQDSPGGANDSASFAYNTTSVAATGLLNFNIIRDFGSVLGTLRLLETESKSKTISAPRVITKDNETANITASKSESYQVLTQNAGTNTISYEQISADLSLSVTPKVSNDGTISMDVNVSNGDFGAANATGGPPNQTNNAVQTKVLIENGSTLVIGGMYQSKETYSTAGVPVLKDLPLIGWLFRTVNKTDPSRKELMIFITPRILNRKGDSSEVSQVTD